MIVISYEKVVILRPVRPKEAVHAGRRQLIRFITTMMAKQSQKERPIEPPTIPVDNVATAMLALSLQRCQYHIAQRRDNDLPEGPSIPDMSSVTLTVRVSNTLNTTCFNGKETAMDPSSNTVVPVNSSLLDLIRRLASGDFVFGAHLGV